jgi:glycosyltransferase involved in cell wall biosynthesis
MKFIFVGSEKQLYLGKIGGIENIIVELASGLVQGGHQVQFFIQSSESLTQSVFCSSYAIKEVVGSKREIRQLMLHSKPDYFLLLESLFQNPLFFIRFYFKSKIEDFLLVKMIFTYPAIKGNRFLEKIKYRFFIDSAIVFSKRLASDLQNNWNGKVFTMFPPISPKYSHLKNRSYGEKIRIGYVGRLSLDKGTHIIKEIMDKLDDEKYEFFIFGYYSEEQNPKFHLKNKNIHLEIKEQSAHNISIKAPLEKIDILVLPYQSLDSKTVDTPILILEGLSAGCIVVTSNLESIREIHPAIRLVDNYSDSESFINEIKEIDVTSYERQDCSQFSTDSFVTKFLEYTK